MRTPHTVPRGFYLMLCRQSITPELLRLLQ